jgi:hypothetical protein
MEIEPNKELSMLHKLFIECQNNMDKKNIEKLYTQTDIGSIIDPKYPNTQTYHFIQKLIDDKILVSHHQFEFHGRKRDIYIIDYDQLLDIIYETKAYKIVEEFMDARLTIKF